MSDSDILAVPCIDCMAKVGFPCIWPPAVSPSEPPALFHANRISDAWNALPKTGELSAAQMDADELASGEV